MKLDPFIEAEKTAGHSVQRTCALFEVSKSAYYERRNGAPSRRDVTDAELLELIRAIHKESNGTYGAPRIHKELLHRHVAAGKRKVTRLMRQAGLEGRCKKRWRKTTVADPDAEAAKDLIQRHFGPCTEMDRRYVGDITYISTWEGWAYLATVMDLASRRVVGWALADHLRTELVEDALAMAFANRAPQRGVIFHSDRGGQGEFNRSSQHLDRGGVDGPASGMDEGVDGSLLDEVAGGAVTSTGGRARVLASDRHGVHGRGGRAGGRGVPGRRRSLVPAPWRHADRSFPGHGPVLVVSRARGDRSLKGAGRRGPGDRSTSGTASFDGLARTAPERGDPRGQA